MPELLAESLGAQEVEARAIASKLDAAGTARSTDEPRNPLRSLEGLMIVICHGWIHRRAAYAQRFEDITLYAIDADAGTSLGRFWPQIQGVLSTRRKSGKKRITQPLCARNPSAFFIKTSALNSIPSRIRATLGIRRRSGLYDWALEELHNHTEAQKRTHLIPKLMGYGVVRLRGGLISEVFLSYEHLAGWDNGYDWLHKNTSQVLQFAEVGIGLIMQLNREGIYHLDLWAGNMMVHGIELANLKAIDLENCFIEDNQHPSETLGFQLAFLYQHQLSKLISEELYDQLVDIHITKLQDLQKDRFGIFYKHFKHHTADRKERHRIPKTGRWPSLNPEDFAR